MLKKYNIFIIFTVFCLLYNPPILSFNIWHILAIISWMFIILELKQIRKYIFTQRIIKACIVLILIFLYIMLVDIYNNNRINNVIDLIFYIFDIVPISIMVTYYFRKKEIADNEFVVFLLLVGNIQGILALLAFVFPSCQSLFVDMLLNAGYGNVVEQLSSHRMFGLASNLTFSTPVLQSILACIAFYMTIRHNWKYLFFCPLLLFSGIINARISIVILAIGIVLVFLSNMKMKYFFRLLIAIFIGIFVFNYILQFLEINSSITYDWIEQGINEITEFFKGDTTGYFSYVTNENKYKLPSGMKLLFGTGIRVMFSNQYNFVSDIGFINDIWFGGIIYCILIYSFYIRILVQISKMSLLDGLNRYIALLFFCILITSNIKGYVFAVNNIICFVWFVYIYIVMSVNKNNGEEEVNNEKVKYYYSHL